MTAEVRANRYKELVENPLWKEIIEYFENERDVSESIADSTPSPEANSGWFALREQAIGSKVEAKEALIFLQQTLSQP